MTPSTEDFPTQGCSLRQDALYLRVIFPSSQCVCLSRDERIRPVEAYGAVEWLVRVRTKDSVPLKLTQCIQWTKEQVELVVRAS
jgi:hypothetical protein